MKKLLKSVIVSLIFLSLIFTGCFSDEGTGDITQNGNANLSAISISSGELSPSFSSLQTSYNVVLPSDATSITITPVAEDVNSTVSVDNVVVPSGGSSMVVNLTMEPQDIVIIVIAADGITWKTYTVTVVRNLLQANNPDLSNLEVSSGTLIPGFSANTTDYTLVVEYGISSIRITPTAVNSNSTIKVDGDIVESGTESDSIELDVGENSPIPVFVLAENGITNKFYRVTVTRLSGYNDAADLSALEISAGTLTPVFSGEEENYSVEVEAHNSWVRFTPTEKNAGSTIKVDGEEVDSGTDSSLIDIAYGDNPITIHVTASDLTEKTYTVTVTRPVSEINLVVPVEMLQHPVHSRTNQVIVDISETSLVKDLYDGTVTYEFEVVGNNSDSTARAIDIIDSTDTVRGCTAPQKL